MNSSTAVRSSPRQRQRARSAARKNAARVASQNHLENLVRAHRREGKRHAKTISTLQKALGQIETTKLETTEKEDFAQLVTHNRRLEQRVIQLESRQSELVAIAAKLNLCLQKWEHRANHLQNQRDALRRLAPPVAFCADLLPGCPESHHTSQSTPQQSPRTPCRFNPDQFMTGGTMKFGVKRVHESKIRTGPEPYMSRSGPGQYMSKSAYVQAQGQGPEWGGPSTEPAPGTYPG
eukprot:CAMPEP_0172189274 /NCGR_PEP_ID=MMETSP1050-20130122/22426_1 /TAXON_ID=233186 /ORGANISM="Cryptomonas curvata, Strain CCAP979/52" /LENGTH=234 /DNA_ID=CAMNT_0012863937 /DNA_START=372 /DNA_END=1077 /DNA_ORIENTATION=-